METDNLVLEPRFTTQAGRKTVLMENDILEYNSRSYSFSVKRQLEHSGNALYLRGDDKLFLSKKLQPHDVLHIMEFIAASAGLRLEVFFINKQGKTSGRLIK